MATRVSFDLSDKIIVVTGAGKGIGKAISTVCAEFGADLALDQRARLTG